MTTLIGEQITCLSIVDSRLYFSNQLKEIGFIELGKLESSAISKFTKNTAHNDQIGNIFEYDSQHLLTLSEDRTARLLDKNTCKFEINLVNTVDEFVGHRSGITCVDWNDEILVTGSEDNTVLTYFMNNSVERRHIRKLLVQEEQYSLKYNTYNAALQSKSKTYKKAGSKSPKKTKK